MKAWLLLSAWLAAMAPAFAQPDCTPATQLTQAHLQGTWRAEVQGSWYAATLQLGQHPEYAESLRGAIERNGERSLVAGDIEQGELTLEESADGKRISATWLGEVVEGSCGREIRGTRQAEGDPKAQAFVLRKQ